MVHTHSRPMRSLSPPSRIWPGIPTALTIPRPQAAVMGSKPISIRYLVWWTWTAYQANRAVKKPTAIHQKRAVRAARASVHSVAAHSASTMLEGRRVALAVGQQAQALGPAAHQKIERTQRQQHDQAHGPARGAPAVVGDDA